MGVRKLDAARGVLVAVVGVAALVLSAGAAGAQAPGYMEASAFLDTLGVNVHLNYKDTVYSSPRAVARGLEFLGVRHVRQGFPFNWSAGGAQLQDVVFMSGGGFDFD